MHTRTHEDTRARATGESEGVGEDMADPDDAIYLGDWEAWGAMLGVLGWYVLEYMILGAVLDAIPSMTIDIIQHQNSIDGVKDTVRNTWTNIALVAALIIGMTAAMLCSSELADLGYTYSGATALRTAYYCFSGLATCQYGQAILECVIHLVYTEPLDPAGVMRCTPLHPLIFAPLR